MYEFLILSMNIAIFEFSFYVIAQIVSVLKPCRRVVCQSEREVIAMRIDQVVESIVVGNAVDKRKYKKAILKSLKDQLGKSQFVSDATSRFPGQPDPVRCIYVPTNHLTESLVDRIKDGMH